jgi:hypothetical protein
MNINPMALALLATLSWAGSDSALAAETNYYCHVTDSTGKTVMYRPGGPMPVESDLFGVQASGEKEAATKAIAAANKQVPNSAVAACCREQAARSGIAQERTADRPRLSCIS